MSENKARATQVAKYGGEEGFKAEMRRRRSLVKSPGFASMGADKHKELSAKGGKNSWKNRDGQNKTIPG